MHAGRYEQSGATEKFRQYEKKLGIIETLKAAKTVKQVNELTKKLETYDQVSAKTVRKFTRVSKKKRAEIKKKS